jgi:hypothetical protein
MTNPVGPSSADGGANQSLVTPNRCKPTPLFTSWTLVDLCYSSYDHSPLPLDTCFDTTTYILDAR